MAGGPGLSSFLAPKKKVVFICWVNDLRAFSAKSHVISGDRKISKTYQLICDLEKEQFYYTLSYSASTNYLPNPILSTCFSFF